MPAKGEKIEDKAYLEMLAKARERANAVRKEKADQKRKIKLAQEIEHQQKVAEAEAKIKKIVKPAEPGEAAARVSREAEVIEKPIEKKKKVKKPPPPKSSSESELETEEEESEEEVEEKEPPQKAKTIKKSVKSVSQPQQYQPKQPQQLTPQQRRLMSAYKSLFT